MIAFINSYGLYILGILVVALFGYLGKILKRVSDTLVDSEFKRAVADVVVQFVEQVFQNLHGEDKLNKALEQAEMLLAKKGIKFDADEMKVFIEAAVAKFNEAFAKKKIA